MTGQQLKNSILQLAIQGKLVPQIESEGTAEDLLKEIRAEKEKLVKEGKLKKKDLEVKPIEDDEIPFEIPEGWRWCRMNDLAEYKKGPFGSSLTKSMFVQKSISSIKVYEQKNAIKKDFQLGDYYISKEKFTSMESFTVYPLDIIVSCAGTIGETYQLPEEAPLGIINQALMRVRLFQLELSDYWMLYFKDMLNHNTEMKGAGSAIKNIPPFEIFKNIPVPLPPLSEQKRIVAKIEELMPMVEEYGKAQERLEALNKELPEKLKKSVLQEAIMGKLVPQDPKEGTAEELLAEIRKEKEKLVKEGKLKKKDLEVKPIEDDEIPFEIPKGWKWVRIPDIGISQLGKTKNPNQIKGDNLPYLCSINIYWDGIRMEQLKTMLFEEGELDKYKVIKGDLLICEGGDCGRSAIWEFEETCLYQNALHRVRFYCNIDAYYVKNCLELYSLNGYLDDFIKGETIKHLVKGQLDSILFPLPPLAEQKRIVAKLEEVMEKIEGMK